MVVSSQVLLYLLNYRNFRRVVPGYRLDLRRAKLSMFAQLVRYGKHTFLANASWEVVNQGPAVLIGHFLPTAYVGYYAVPTRLIQVSVTATDSVMSVSGSNAAELTAKQEMDTVPLLGVLVNRYCLTVFMPIAIILWIYRNEVIHAWIRKSAYVAHSAPLLPILLVGAIWVLVGQVNTAPILYGLGKHQGYARGVLVEACLSVSLLVYTIPRYGLLGAASVAMGLMILNRGIYLPWYLCRVLQFPYSRYMAGIYTRPLLTAVPLFAVIYFLKVVIFPGQSLVEIAAVSTIAGGLGWGLGYFTVLEPEHRALLLQLVTGFPARVISMVRGQAVNV
jgi:O-antigen/teichoic acid export membrane protein